MNYQQLLGCVILTLYLVPFSLCDNGIMYSRIDGTDSWDDKFCIAYNPSFLQLPVEDDATVYRLSDLSSKYGCNASDYQSTNVTNSIVIVARTQCLFSQKALIAQQFGAKGIVIASDELIMPSPGNVSDYAMINISVATALWSDIHDMYKKDSKHDAILFMPTVSKFDPNLVVTFLIAVSNIALGGYWAGKKKHSKYERLKYKHKREQPSSDSQNESDNTRRNSSSSNDDDDDDDDSVDVSIVVIIVFFVLVCAFLILLYFFFDYLVYVVIALFCIAGAMGLYYCLIPIWHKICPFYNRLPKNKVPLFKSRPFYRDLALLAVCLGVAIFWGIQRHAPYAWVIQDILGYAFCINVMKTVGVPNMKVCTVLLTLLFLYDIFFVFISPLFTKSGDSIMVKVATGGDSQTHEQLPMVFMVPRLTNDVISLCPLPFSILGFGDIVIPGLLVSHNHAFDLRVHSKFRIYYVLTCIGYAVGLIITFVALGLMKTGQPALLYLVPCTLFTTYIIGCIRGEVRLLWHGVTSDSDRDSSNVNYSSTVDAPPIETVPESRVVSSEGTQSTSSSLSNGDNENRELLRK
ncbi:Signal peptide peptidase-like 2B [Mactra antiquata]